MKVFVSEHAVRCWKEKRLRWRDYTFRGLKQTEWYIVTVDCQEPAAYRQGGNMIVHPVIYQQLKNDPNLREVFSL